jgi:Leucine-rich repeat (LRR) protein
MKKYIKELEEKIDLQIIESNIPIHLENTYSTDQLGNITALRLMEVPLKNLNILFPIANYLKELYLVDCDLTSITEVGRFEQLESIDLSVNDLSDVHGLEQLDSLKKLYLSGNKIDSNNKFESFHRLKNLEYLDLDGNRISSLSGLENLENLQTLIIGGTEIEHFDDVTIMKRLENLDLNCCHNIDFTKNIDSEKFPCLRTLNLNSCSMNEIQGLSELRTLTNLNLSSCNLFQSQGLEDLSELKVLRMDENCITKIEGLQNLRNLETLSVKHHLGYSDSPLTKIEGLTQMDKLKELNLSGNEISELIDLPTENLQSLNVSWNKIERIDYDWLKSIKQPCIINLTGNPLKLNFDEIPDHITIIDKRKD